MLTFGVVLGLALTMSHGVAAAPPGAPNSVTRAAVPPRILDSFANLPLRFELNRGQADPQVKFLSRGSGYTMFLTEDGVVFSLQGGKSKVERGGEFPGLRNADPESQLRNVLRLKFVGSAAHSSAKGADELPGKSNYFRGSDPRQWHTNVPNYSRVRYEQLYPGIDLVYYGNEGRLEYDFVVGPGADPRAIRFEIDERNPKSEIRKAKIDAHGDLVMATAAGEVRFHKPVVYQEELAVSSRQSAEGSRQLAGSPSHESRAPNPDSSNHKSQFTNHKSIEGRFVLLAGNRVGFEVGDYDRRKPLIIDPVLTYSTFLGGTNGDIGYGVAVDADGNAYVTGSTGSTNFPTATPLQAAPGGDFDIFVAKVNPTGTALVYSTYLGGVGFDRATALAVDASGNVFLTGMTTSSNFPTTTGAFQTAFGGGACGTTACSDAFVIKLNPDGSALVYSTYLGGADSDAGQGIALDGSGDAYVTGSTLSANFPTSSPIQATGGGGTDAFVTKMKPDGSGLVYSTYLGGTDGDFGRAIAVNSAGNAYVTGYTFSTNFATASPLQATNGGSADIFVAELDSAGSALVYSTYLGGTGVDRAFALTLDAFGDVFITGDTSSSADFPVTPGAYQTTFGGGTCGSAPCSDAFVAELDPTGATILYSTFLGGANNDSGSAIALDSTGRVFITGSTFSADFPVVSAIQTSFGGGTCGSGPCSDAFVTVLDPVASTLAYSTFLGGTLTDFGQAIAVDESDNAFVTGGTSSATFPATFGVIQVARGGNSPAGDAFLVKIGTADAPAVALSPQKLTFADKATGFTSDEQTITLTNSGSAALSITSIVAHGDFAVAGTTTCADLLAAGGATCAINVTFTPTTTGDRTGDVTITDNAGGSPHVIPLTGKGITPAPAVTLDPTSLEFTDQTYNTTSAAQTITLTNSGTAALTITAIAITGDFAQTNDCPVSPATLAVNASCTFGVTFTPKSSGERTGTITITDNGSNATSGKHTAGLKGNGLAVFTLTSDTTTTIVTRGVDSTTFAIKAQGPADFTSSVTLACTNSGSASCAFNPTTLKVGETSTLTVSNLKQFTAAAAAFTVTGTFETQTSNLPITINFADFALATDPSFGTVTSGDSKAFAMTLTPAFGFTGSASFTCVNLPAETTCAFDPTTVSLDGTNAATVQVTLKTTVRTTQQTPPRPRGPWPWVGGLLVIATVARLAVGGRRRASAALLAALLLGLLTLSSCNDYYFSFRGTLPGTYSVVVNAKVGDVSHSTFFSLTVN
ncbi:MAG: SBBP repeat-containing protein [Terriglobia bacterium]